MAGSTAKRKVVEEGDVLSKAAKRTKIDVPLQSNGTGKRKLHGEEQIGGLVIVRGPPPRPSSAQDNHRLPSSQPQFPPRSASTQPDHPMNAGPSRAKSQPASTTSLKPNSSLGRATVRLRADAKGKERKIPLLNGTGDDEGAEEEVRRMNSEANALREQSRALAASVPSGALQVDFKFPPPPGTTVKSRVRQLQGKSGAGRRNLGGLGTPPMKSAGRDSMQPVIEQETPQIAKNKLLRGEHPSMKLSAVPSQSVEPEMTAGSRIASGSDLGTTAAGHSRRRSSISMRGKRVSTSFETTGVITRPHTSVSDSSLYKHIDPDLPESQRARQLLIWAAGRAKSDTPGSSTPQRRKSTAASRASPLPPLPSGGLELLKSVEDDVIQQLAEKLIDTSVYSPPDEGVSRTKKVKENEQNVKNRAREKLFLEQIEERKAEDSAWAEASQFYNAHQKNVLSALDKGSRSRTPTSATAKGKQRAISQEPEDVEPWEHELPEQFRGSNGFDVARKLTERGVDVVGTGDKRGSTFRYKTDRIHSAVSAAHELARIASSDLDHRFSLLSVSLSQRLPPAPHQSFSSKNPAAPSNYLPHSQLPQQPVADPREILRALSRTDAERPRQAVGDAARRAAKDVQRVNEGAVGGLSERRLTGVPAPTPRKPPGTPRRSNTPGTSRKG